MLIRAIFPISTQTQACYRKISQISSPSLSRSVHHRRWSPEFRQGAAEQGDTPRVYLQRAPRDLLNNHANVINYYRDTFYEPLLSSSGLTDGPEVVCRTNSYPTGIAFA